MHVGKDYPLGQAYVREKAKAAILKNKDLDVTDQAAFHKAINAGRWWVNELIGVIKLRKYRTMKQRYGNSDALVHEMEADLLKKATIAGVQTDASRASDKVELR